LHLESPTVSIQVGVEIYTRGWANQTEVPLIRVCLRYK